MNKLYIFGLAFLLSFSCSAAGGSNHKATFAEKDVFQTAHFIENVPGLINDHKGQPVRYFADHDGVSVYLTDEGPVYKLVQKDEKKAKEIAEERAEAQRSGKRVEEKEGTPVRVSYTTMKWIGANPHPVIDGGGKSSGHYSFLAGDPKNKESLHSIMADGYSTLTYHDLYPGIDVEYSFPDQGGMKYNLIVHPGADASRIQMEYGGSFKKLTTDQAGNMTVHTETGDMLEHAPVSFAAGEYSVSTSYAVKGNRVTFSLPQAYDRSQTLVIDPWVTALTQLTVRNLGTNSDYDAAGDLIVYGAGGWSVTDITNLQKVVKYDPTGAFLWVFMGSVPAVSWSTAVNTYDYLSNAKVDRVTGKIYVGQAFNSTGGSQMVRLTPAGVYDNFISTANVDFEETWSFEANCSTGEILALGGGLNSPLNMGIVNPVTATVSTSNITGITGTYLQDIVSGAYDASGNLYVVFNSNGTPSLQNVLMRANTAYTGHVWQVPTGFGSFTEADNVPAYGSFGNSNNFNALAANADYLYLYDGFHLAAYDLATGSVVGTPTSMSFLYDSLVHGGIAVDNCNHLYIGGQGVIKTFTFNGTSFTPGGDIPLGTGFNGDTILDVRYNATNNLLYVTGSQIAGTYNATLSHTCTVVSASFTDSVIPGCQMSIVTVTPGVGLINPTFSYIWEDSAGTIVRQTSPGTALSDTLTGLSNGRYTVQAQLNVNCGGASIVDTFTVLCNNLTISHDTAICAGQSVVLTAAGLPIGGAYLWSPGGATTASITVTPSLSTTYTVTYTPSFGPSITDSVTVTVLHSATVSVNDTTACSGQTTSLTATPSVGGGTYSWTPGGFTTQSITVSPTTTTTYTVTYTSANCGSATGSGTVTITSTPTMSVSDTSVCPGQSAMLTASPSILGGTYSWSPGGGTTQTITVSPATTTTYTVTYISSTCGTAVDSGIVTITAPPTVSVNDTSVCSGQSATLTATASMTGGTYSWTPGSSTTQSITVSPTTTTTYTVTYSTAFCGTAVNSGTVTITPGPTVTLSADTSICHGASAVLTATPSYGGGAYSWTPVTASTQAVTVSPTATTSYTVTYTVAGCVPATASETVNVYPAITLTLSAENPSCFGFTDGLVTSSVQPTNSYSYHWDNSTTTANDSNLIAGNYGLTVTDPNGCTASASATVNPANPALLEILPSDTTVLQGNSVQLNTVFAGFPSLAITSYDWTPATGLSCTNCPNPLDTTGPNTDTLSIFQLTVTYNNGCIVTASDTVRMIPPALAAPPSAFTPDGDGKNEEFLILTNGPVNQFSLNIYNRWGQLVFTSADPKVGWNGTYKEIPQPAGDYTYFYGIQYESGKSEYRNGTLNLFR